MSVSRALGTSLKVKKMSLRDLRKAGVPYGESMLSMIQTGRRDVAPDVAPILAAKVDHVSLYAALNRKATGFGPEYLDGAYIDHHPAAVKERSIVELHEALDAIEAEVTKVPEAESEAERRRRRQHLMEVLDVISWLLTYFGCQCDTYGFSAKQLDEEHHQLMRSRRWVSE